MDDKTMSLLNEARGEIVDLRRQNELLSARLEGAEMVAMAVASVAPPRPPQGMKECVVHKIDRHIFDAVPAESEVPS